MVPIDSVINIDYKNSYSVILDGIVIGHVVNERASVLVAMLRESKILGKDIPNTLEIILVPKKKVKFPNCFLCDRIFHIF